MFASDVGDSPVIRGVAIPEPFQFRAAALITLILLYLCLVHTTDHSIIVGENEQITLVKARGLIAVDGDAAYLNRAIANESIIDNHVSRAFRLLGIVVPHSCSPGIGAETGKGSIEIVEDALERILVADPHVDV